MRVVIWGKWHFNVSPTALKYALVLLLCLIFTILLALCMGSHAVSILKILSPLTGYGSEFEKFVLFEIRLPRIFATAVAGFTLGMAGLIAQTLFRNQLATPDVLGINEGSALAVVSYVLMTVTSVWPFWIAPLGAMIAVGLLYLVSDRFERDETTIFLLSGVCIAEFFRAIIEFLMSTGALHEVQGIYFWLHGSFIGQGYQSSLPALILVMVTLPLTFYFGYHLPFLSVDPRLAKSIGVPVQRLRRLGIFLLAGFAAFGTAIGGPVAFVAMAAPIVVRFLLFTTPLSLVLSGFMGSIILIGSDTAARSFVQPQEIATGIVTRILGGVLLLLLLAGGQSKYKL